MSNSGLRRIKEYGAAGGKITDSSAPATSTSTRKASSHTPSTTNSGESSKKLSGKENPRPSSRVRAATTMLPHNPAIRPIPSINKSSSRGRSPSPCDFNRVFLDLPRDKVSTDRTDKRLRVEPEVKASSVQKKVFLRGSKPKSRNNDEIDGGCFENVEKTELIEKNPKKLYERLAFLEEKVNRLSFDIKMTKDMLDQNNLDSSKFKLSDIQEKIFGIEKEMMVHHDETSSNPMRGETDDLLLQPIETHETDVSTGSAAAQEYPSCMVKAELDPEIILTTDEKLDDFDDQENEASAMNLEEKEDSSIYKLKEIGFKNSTGGWFVSEGGVVLAHDDSTCSFYDITNCEEKTEYRPPIGVSPNLWRDCWIIRAPGSESSSEKYVVAASAGNTKESGFCSWDFYSKDVRAFHIEDSTLAPQENWQWWYKPCGPLIVSAASCHKCVKVYDIRDGEETMKWELHKPVSTMDYSSPIQWRNKGKVVVAEEEAISVWDVSSTSSRALLNVPASSGRKITALHVNNTDAEVGGGVRQRASSSETEGNDGVFCTSNSINVLDFRHPSGIGLKIPKQSINAHSIFSRGDSVYIGCSQSQVQQFSIRKQRLLNVYLLPQSNNEHPHYTQVWGNSNFVMGVCGLGLYVFDDASSTTITTSSVCHNNVKDVIGPDNLYSPSFDYHSARVLLISRDRPAYWRYMY